MNLSDIYKKGNLNQERRWGGGGGRGDLHNCLMAHQLFHHFNGAKKGRKFFFI
jgi:hypothetical protein